MSIVSDELKPGPFTVKHLTAARDKARFAGILRPNRVRNSDVCRVHFCVSEFPGDAASLRVKREANSPHHARLVRICKRLVLTDNLNRKSSSSGNRLDMIMQIKIVDRPAN